MDTSQIKLQVWILEAQVAGLETQLRALKEIKCPNPECEWGRIRVYENPENTNYWRNEDCNVCEGTGFAAGTAGNRR